MAKLNGAKRDHGGWSHAGATWLCILVLTLVATGIAMHGQDADAIMERSGWQEQWHHAATVLHGVFAWIFCLVAGRWMWPHIALVWVRRTSNWNWELGIAMALASVIAALTGLGLLYGAAGWREALSSVHWWVGLAWPAIGIWHGWKWIAEGLWSSGR